MKKLYTLIIGLAMVLGTGVAKADEGMWIPALLTNNYEEMKKLGLELTPEQLYSINHSSMKDAIVRLGSGFCTGEIISNKGLILTNHHCGYGAIQSLSTTSANHLKNGFWAKNHSEELPAGFSISFLVKIEEITDQVLDGVTDDLSFMDRSKAIGNAATALRTELAEDGKYSVDIKSMFSGNRFFAYVYQIFDDVRLVGTPPEAVGKYGGDTDNWMWPRHTGDFSMFRVYADKDNNPAAYSEDNVPYTPKHHLPVSMSGVDQGDFAMIWGFPGSTDRYLSSWGVKLATEKDQPARVKIRRSKLDIYEKYQNQSDVVDLMYASKHARVSNYWKYFIGQTRGLKRLNVYDKKKNEEAEFQAWVNQGDQARKDKYGQVLSMYEEAYGIYDRIQLAQAYWMEAMYGIEFVGYGFSFNQLLNIYDAIEVEQDAERKAELQNELNAEIEALKADADAHFKDYYMPIDQEVTKAMLDFYVSDIPEDLRPAELNDMLDDCKYNTQKFTDRLFKRSMLVSKDRVLEFLAKPSAKKLRKDMGYKMSSYLLSFYRNELNKMSGPADMKRATADRLYKAALFEMHPDKAYSPNANSSMRFTYGQVLEYSPGDAMLYKHFTTMGGVLEKYQPGDHEFDLPEYYLEKARNKDYGRYAKPGEDLRICFLSNNDITGGNSGSPVINGKGQLIGLAFDGNWEAMSGDIAFEPELQRTISVDIRYVLWCIDKLAGARHIVDEMSLVYPIEEEATPAAPEAVPVLPTDQDVPVLPTAE